jgi:hypothetical protein
MFFALPAADHGLNLTFKISTKMIDAQLSSPFQVLKDVNYVL